GHGGKHLRHLCALVLLLRGLHLIDALLLEARDVGLDRLHRRVAEIDRRELDLIRRRHLRAVAEQPGHQQHHFHVHPPRALHCGLCRPEHPRQCARLQSLSIREDVRWDDRRPLAMLLGPEAAPMTALDSLLDDLAAYLGTPDDACLSLPPAAYTAPDLHALERERIFRHAWLCVGRDEYVANPGDYYRIDVLDEPMM